MVTMKKRQLGPCVTFFPQPTTLVATRDAVGQTNLMMASWAGIVSKTPATMAVSLQHTRRTFANILETKKFSVNVVPCRLAEQADFCGIVSGNDLDKAAVAGLHVEDSVDETPLLVESPLSVECRFSRVVELGDYRLTLGEIIEIHAAETAFQPDGQVDARVFDPLVYLGGLKEYWSLGDKQADAYRAGLKFKY